MRKEHLHVAADDIRRGYDASDISVAALAKWLIALFVFIGLTSLLTLGFYFVLAPIKEQARSAEGGPDRRMPPDPRVQSDPARDIVDYRAKEEKVLNSYTIDPKSGAIRIPINQAVDIVAAKGLAAVQKKGPETVGRPEQAMPGGGLMRVPSSQPVGESLRPSTVPSPGNADQAHPAQTPAPPGGGTGERGEATQGTGAPPPADPGAAPGSAGR